MKTLIMLSAIPASGKSTWARNYKEQHENTYIISSDGIRMELTNGDYHDRSKQAEVWKVFSERIHEFGKIDNVTVILDALNDTNALREKYVKEKRAEGLKNFGYGDGYMYLSEYLDRSVEGECRKLLSCRVATILVEVIALDSAECREFETAYFAVCLEWVDACESDPFSISNALLVVRSVEWELCDILISAAYAC